jgi:hypothetical protein
MKLNTFKAGTDMDYLTVKEAGEKLGITSRLVIYYCIARRIKCAEKKVNLCLVPNDAEKPIDGRYKEHTQKSFRIDTEE